MATENHETSNGWPLGLQIMSIRLRLLERLQASAPPPALEPYALHIPTSSFSSFSSSNLDTEVTPRTPFFSSFFAIYSIRSLGLGSRLVLGTLRPKHFNVHIRCIREFYNTAFHS
ncbi:hypothetical protein PTKIN_Ptkin18bG0120000 [Pterospermum kingtungense]